MFDPKYQIIVNALSFQSAADSDFGNVVYWRDMMLLGSVLLPAEPTPAEGGDKPAFYLDDTDVRTLIQAELDITLRDFMRKRPRRLVGRLPGRTRSAPRRRAASCAGSMSSTGTTRSDGRWPVSPTEIEKDAEGSTIPAGAVCPARPRGGHRPDALPSTRPVKPSTLNPQPTLEAP